jgi:phospholipase C
MRNMRRRRPDNGPVRRALTVLTVSALVLVACSTATPPTATGADAARSGEPCGWRDQAPRTWDHVVWVVLENHSFGDLIGDPGSAAATTSPYLTRLARSCGLATDFWAVTHPSLPNYLAMVSGRTGGVTRSCTPAQCPQHRRTVFDQLRRQDMTWRVFAESMPGACRRTDAYPYVVRHNPPTYFPGVAGCGRRDLPMGTTSEGRLVDVLAAGRLPELTLVVPDQCHNTHDCPVGEGDRWLSELLPTILDGADYREGRTAVFVTWDEGAGGDPGQSCRRAPDESCHIVTVVVSPTTVPGTRSGTRYDLYSLLETTERMLGITTFLGHAADERTRSMRPAFGL